MRRVRRRGSDGVSQRASSLELFYDLVFVFAITQVSHLLLTHLTWAGVLQAAIVLLAVYWSWNYTTWTTNELDTETVPVRLLLLGLMLVSLLMSVAIPKAFGDQALLFAGSYVAIQVGRHSFLAFAAADSGTVERERAGRILTWFVAVGVLWIAGAFVDGTGRYVLWLVALSLDYCAPFVTYWVPGRRRLAPETWNVGTEHFAERFGLFIILTLGESIVITGATTSEGVLNWKTILAFVMAFLASAAIWWLYFTSVAALGEHYLEVADHRTTLARDAYTVLHVVFVAGIILSAVGDELVIAHPTDVLPPYEVAAVAAGPAVYLLAHSLFTRRLTGKWYPSKLLGTLACVAVGFVGLFVPALVLAAALILVLVAVIAAGYLAPRSRVEGAELRQG
ncbi:MAG TPA: low temperature requirement protein A [Rubrobacter sp.]|jgi:low temperature requirement protein LtrA|nr:low temperature requirement protein A [Rubrobacter sp.]